MAGAYYIVRLHFAEYRYDADGYGGKPDRLFNVGINGKTVLSNFNVYAAAGAQYKAVTKIFDTAADSSGKITIVFTGGTDNAEIKAIEAVGPIQITNPNPLGRPDKGDGSNQFVYDATTLDGFLSFPGGVNIPGAVANETAWIMRDPADINGPHVSLTPDLPAESISQGWNLYDHTLVPSIPISSILIKHGDLSNLSDGYLYKGLPKSNSDFGNHLVTMNVDGNALQQAHIQTFFIGIDANKSIVANYPNASSNLGPDNSVIPNWYYYYNQVYASPGTYDHLGEDSGQTASHIDLSPPYAVHIHDDAYGQYNIPVYCLSNPIKTTDLVSCLGNLSISGVHAYIFLCAHEAGHQSLSLQKDASGLPLVYNWSPKDANSDC